MKETLQKVIYFFNEQIWEDHTKNRPAYYRFAINALRVIILAFKGFKKDECPIRSSALTYFSLLSIVPVIAVAFAISKGFGLEQILEREISKNLASQKEVMTYLLTFSKSMLDSAKGGILAVIAIGVLLYTVLKLFHHIENAVNTIWNIERSRTFLRKFTDYLSIVIIAPILLVASGTANVYISTILMDISKDSFLELLSPVFFFFIKLVPYITIWLLFTLMYMIMPNKKVKFTHAFIAGLIAGTAYQLIQFYYINLQVGFSRYNAIYGSFAALPLFLIWVQLSWLVFLLGAEISAALNNIRSYGFKKKYEFLSISKKRMLSLLILKKITNEFAKGESPPDTQSLSDSLKLPVQYMSNITENLIAAGLVNEVLYGSKNSSGFQPAKDISQLSFSEAIQKLDNLGDNNILLNEDDDYNNLNQQLDNFSQLVNDNYSQLLIKSI
ncbi:MAG: YihY/virulence factor BrkB family protein [Bacteroidales bacterium]|nr:YihY/virulence factor BrkB family protein [Bacteroidales bacterium]